MFKLFVYFKLKSYICSMKTLQILEDYKNKMFTKDIMVKYNISWEKLTKILKENNVYKKNNSLVYTDETLDFLKNNYGKMSNKDISKFLNISEDWLIVKIKQLGIKLKGSGTVYKPNLENIDINSQTFKYFLGWMAADGNISKTYRNISLSITDEEIILKFKEYFPESKLYIQPKKNQKTMYQLMICSTKFGKELEKFGITPNKTKTLNIPSEMWNTDFVRGFFEGDGHIRNTKNGKYDRYEAGFVSASEIFTDQLVYFLNQNNIYCTKTLENNSYYRIRITGKENLFIFYTLLYSNCNQWYLTRKKQILDLLFSNE